MNNLDNSVPPPETLEDAKKQLEEKQAAYNKVFEKLKIAEDEFKAKEATAEAARASKAATKANTEMLEAHVKFLNLKGEAEVEFNRVLVAEGHVSRLEGEVSPAMPPNRALTPPSGTLTPSSRVVTPPSIPFTSGNKYSLMFQLSKQSSLFCTSFKTFCNFQRSRRRRVSPR